MHILIYIRKCLCIGEQRLAGDDIWLILRTLFTGKKNCHYSRAGTYTYAQTLKTQRYFCFVIVVVLVGGSCSWLVIDGHFGSFSAKTHTGIELISWLSGLATVHRTREQAEHHNNYSETEFKSIVSPFNRNSCAIIKTTTVWAT